MKALFSLFLSFFALMRVSTAHAAWTPLIASTDFDGIKTDVLTTAGGILAVLLVIIGVGLLVRVLGR